MRNAEAVRLQNVGEHASDGRLPVRTGDDDRSGRKAPRDLADEPWVDALRD
jgi:hypothetical protein